MATIIAAVFIAVTGATGFFVWRQTNQDFISRKTELAVTANVFSSVVARPLARKDKAETLAALRAIARLPQIPYIVVLDAQDKPFASLGSAVLLTSGKRKLTGGGLIEFLRTEAMPVRVPVTNAGTRVGSLLLLADISDLRRRLEYGLLLTFLVASAASMVGVAVASGMRRKIVMPITDLAETMNQVRVTHDFSKRVVKETNDETGDLVEAFNDMLAQISKRDRALARHRETLEQTVEERTRELREARDAAENANRAKSDFLATMSHEIRTPMNGVMVMAELLAAAGLQPRQQRYAEVIVRSGQSLLTIINDILDLSKIEAGKLELERVEVSPCRVIDDVMSLFWERAQSKGLDLAAFVMPEVPHQIIGDPVRLNQVLSNLVNNALKFTENGHVAIYARTLGRKADRVDLEFAVIDTGIGIPPDKVDKLFEAFSQADQSTTRKFGGTGLGLAICKRLVEAMGGDIRVESAEGKGSRFIFRITAKVATEGDCLTSEQIGSIKQAVVAVSGTATPIAIASYLRVNGIEATMVAPEEVKAETLSDCQAIFGEPLVLDKLGAIERALPDPYRVVVARIGDMAGEDAVRSGAADDIIMRPVSRREMRDMIERLGRGERRGPAALMATGGEAEMPDFDGARILVADDNAVNREVIIEALRRLNVGVDVVGNGEEAIEAWKTGAYRLVFMDCSMPVMDGFKATEIIRRLETEQAAAGHTPVVALTAHVAGSDADRWRQAGMDDYVIKPFTMKTLAHCLTRWLGEPPAPGASEPAPPPVANAAPRDDIDDSGDEELALLDESILTELGGPGSDLVKRVSRLFVEHVPGALKAIEETAGGGDATTLADAVHALKSMCANIGAARAAAACNELETLARTGGLDDCSAHVARIASEAQAALQAVAELSEAA